jgi:hypothetical protein
MTGLIGKGGLRSADASRVLIAYSLGFVSFNPEPQATVFSHAIACGSGLNDLILTAPGIIYPCPAERPFVSGRDWSPILRISVRKLPEIVG